MTTADFAYLTMRLLLAALSSMSALVTFLYALRLSPHGTRWGVAMVGGVLLMAAATLSVVDALNNVLITPNDPIPLVSWLWLFSFDLLLPLWAVLLVRAWRQRDTAEESLARLAVTDLLTGVLNRRGFFEHAIGPIAHARRTQAPVSVVMFDIDRFKLINDGHGHDAGDVVLRHASRTLATHLRTGDVLGRIGGEEFALLLPGSDLEQAAATAERLRTAVQSGVLHPAGNGAVVTMSAGVAPLSDAGEIEVALLSALSSADSGLYDAKRGGRDRVVITTDSREGQVVR